MADALGESDDDLPRLARASAWRATLFEAGVETSDEFERWLNQDSQNRQAWVRVQDLWTRFGAEATAPLLVEARQRALDGALRPDRQRHFLGRGRLGGRLVAASLAVFISVTALALWRQGSDTHNYQTALGERRTLTLEDGSRIALDAGTRVSVSLRRHSRDVEFLQGQARFDVAHDVSRPFTVHVRGQSVLATGTSFNVDLLGPRLLVTLIEGRVSILKNPNRRRSSAPGAQVVVKLVAGEQLVTGESSLQDRRGAPAPVKVSRVDVDKATAWMTGQLIFEDEPLREVAERVSRYSGHPVHAEGPAGDLKISGVFNSGDTSAFVEAAQQTLSVRADVDEDGIVHLRSAPGN